MKIVDVKPGTRFEYGNFEGVRVTCDPSAFFTESDDVTMVYGTFKFSDGTVVDDCLPFDNDYEVDTYLNHV